ncbi:MAG: hypothetical protein NC092_02205 [Butyrivibrio sp.]|nr:hypothetical protein [Muribaculum sp.]MCM1551486.1 hypothetical protein [Butyrivibrio sp.]
MADMASQAKEEYNENELSARLSEDLVRTEAAVSDFLSAYEENQEQAAETEEIYEILEVVYGFKMYVDDTAAEIYRDGSELQLAVNPYIERYFMVSEGELQDKLGEDTFPALAGAEDYGVFLPVGEDIWLRYEQDDGNAMPIGIVVENPQINIGYGAAKVGMTIHDIEKILGEASQVERMKVEIGEEKASYLCFDDGRYFYYYISTDGAEWLQPTILYITRKAV